MKKQLTALTLAIGLAAFAPAAYSLPQQDTSTQDKKDDKMTHDKMSDGKMDHDKMSDDTMSHGKMSKKKHKKNDKMSDDKMNHDKMSDTTH